MILHTDNTWRLLLGLDEIGEWMTELTDVRVLSRSPSNLSFVSIGTKHFPLKHLIQAIHSRVPSVDKPQTS